MNPKFIPVFLSVLIALAVGIAILFAQRCGYDSASPAGKEQNTSQANSAPPPLSAPRSLNGIDPDIDPNSPVSPTADPTQITPPEAPLFTTPEQLLTEIGKALESGQFDKARQLIGPDRVTARQLAQLAAINGESQLRLLQSGAISEIGEIKRNQLGRWALTFEAPEGKPSPKIVLDIGREPKEKSWTVASVTLPAADGSIPRAAFVDSLGISDAFIQSALDFNFEEARSFVDSERVSDAKIAGLCILFEEGGYKLRQQKPLRSMFSRDNAAGYIANLETPGDSNSKAQFGINSLKNPATGQWRISDIVLDKLLTDYASRVAEGDIYYSPILKNPTGGDTIAIYFEFDQGELTKRTARQISIVASILKLDSKKKISITGHTDSLGSAEYNRELSNTRANTVKTYLVELGVLPNQINIIAAGETRPRRPEVTASGEDDPSGRRANRRTEIYLDF